MRTVWIALAVACSMPPESVAPSVEPTTDPPTPHEADEHDAPPAPVPLDPASVCGRAEQCCRAFAEAVPYVVPGAACAEPSEVSSLDDADARCGRMIDGWRAALERREGVELPDACASATRERSPRR